jgi:hypothetical protein
MIMTTKKFPALILAGLMALCATLHSATAVGQAANAAPQTASASVPVPKPEYVAAGTEEAMKLLRLMDTDKSGKVSRAEFMAFMAAEFDRLDIDHDGELDLKELKNSQLVVTHRGGSRR